MPPVVIAAGIGAAAGIGGGLLSASAQKKAASKAADAATQTAEMNNALQSQIYGENKALLSPYVNRGNSAGDAINALLGLGGPSVQAGPAQGTQQYGPAVPAGTTGGTYGGGGLFGNVPVNSGFGHVIGALGGLQQGAPVFNGGGLFGSGPGSYGAAQNAALAATYQQQQQQAQAAPAGPAPGTGSTAAGSPYDAAFKNYLGSTGYQFQIDQGNKGINQGYAAKGALQSGAALKALQTYGQNTATGFFKDYLGLLSNQQAVGLSGAGAVAGVGTGYANSVSANNNMAGGVAAQSALTAGQANANLYGGIANGIGSVANAAFGSSYTPRAALPPVGDITVNQNALRW
jgi:hypothetical protein